MPPGTVNQTLRYSGTNTLAANSVLTNDGTDLADSGKFTATGIIQGPIRDKAGQVFNVFAYGAVCDAVADDSAAIQAAIDAAATHSGGTVFIPPRPALATTVCNIGTTLDLGHYTGHATHSIRLMGAGNQSGGTGSTSVKLVWTRGVGSGSLITAYGAQSLEIDHLDLAYSSTAYDGSLIDLRVSPENGTCTGGSQNGIACAWGNDCPGGTCSSSPVGLATTNRVFIHDCRVGSTSVIGPYPATLFRLDVTTAVAFANNLFERATTVFDATPLAGVLAGAAPGTTGRSDNVIIRNNGFGSMTAYPILASGENWVIEDNDFSAESSLVKSLDTASAAFPVTGLLYSGNWHTASSNGGTWLRTTGGALLGATIVGNRFSGGAVALNVTNAGPSQGIVIEGNDMATPTGIITGSAGAGAPSSVSVFGNHFTGATPISGTFSGPQLVSSGTGNVTLGGVLLQASIGQGTGMKHARKGSAGCTTSASIGATCTNTITWAGTAFADTSYTALCSCTGVGGGVPMASITTKATGSVTVRTTALTAVAAQCSDLDCVALHD